MVRDIDGAVIINWMKLKKFPSDSIKGKGIKFFQVNIFFSGVFRSQ